MKRYILVLLISMPLLVFGQDYYKETLEKLPQLAPHEQLYLLQDYQAFYPKHANTYFWLGEINYSLYNSEHPIRDYDELKLYLYNSNLFFGNCLHFAQQGKLQTWQYEKVPRAGKKLTFEELDQYLRLKIDTVKDVQSKVDNLYNTYNALVNRYEDCRTLFTNFSNEYISEKHAHLLLNQQTESELSKIKIKSDSLNRDIDNFKAALQNYPIEGYAPEFVKLPIVLYRLDGLTSADFLQNEVPIWDYSAWVEAFQTKQKEYQEYYRELDREYLRMKKAQENALKGRKEVANVNKVILNKIDMLDNESHIYSFLYAEQLAAVSMSYTTQFPKSLSDLADDDQLIDALAAAQAAQNATDLLGKQVAEFDARVKTDNLDKYTLFKSKNFQTKDFYSEPRELLNTTDSCLTARLLDLEKLLVQDQQPKNRVELKNDVSNETLLAISTEEKTDPSANLLRVVRQSDKKKELSSLDIHMHGQLVEILPVDGQFMAVINFTQLFSHQSSQTQMATILIGEDGAIKKTNYFSQPEEALYVKKLQSNNIVVLYKDELGKIRLRTLNNKGEIK